MACDMVAHENVVVAVTTVLIAVDDSDTAVEVARAAHRLFGDAANYLVMHVGGAPYVGMTWGYAYPVRAPAMLNPPTWAGAPDSDVPTGEALAEQQATDVANAASLPDATAVGDVGDPATAILQAGHVHAVDVIIIGSHDRSWFSRLFTGSVERDLMHDADLPVLIVR